jgi:hypothetical protein
MAEINKWYESLGADYYSNSVGEIEWQYIGGVAIPYGVTRFIEFTGKGDPTPEDLAEIQDKALGIEAPYNYTEVVANALKCYVNIVVWRKRLDTFWVFSNRHEEWVKFAEAEYRNYVIKKTKLPVALDYEDMLKKRSEKYANKPTPKNRPSLSLHVDRIRKRDKTEGNGPDPVK